MSKYVSTMDDGGDGMAATMVFYSCLPLTAVPTRFRVVQFLCSLHFGSFEVTDCQWAGGSVL